MLLAQETVAELSPRGVYLDLLLELAGWLLFAYVVGGFFEYSIHRWFMHSYAGRMFTASLWSSHMRMHHGRYYHPGRFSGAGDPAATFISIDFSPLEHVGLLLPIWLPLWFFSPMGAVILLGLITFHAIIWGPLHREMHEPSGRWFSRTWIFRQLRTWHQTHHNHPSSNFGVIFLFWDFVFLTYRRS